MVHFKMMKIILMFALGSRIVFLFCRCMFLLISEHSKPWGILVESNERRALLFQPSPPPPSSLSSSTLQAKYSAYSERKEAGNSPLYCALFANIFSVKTFCRLCLLLCQVHHCASFHVNDLECYFFLKECILKRNSDFCFCLLSQTLFSPIFSFPHRML